MATSASTSASATEPPISPVFTCFLKLPTEIRLMIWNIEACRPVLVGVADPGDDSEYLVGTIAQCPLLTVSTEARQVAIKVKGEEGALGTKIYADFDIDTIWLTGITTPKSWYSLKKKLLLGNGNKIKRLAINIEHLYEKHVCHGWEFSFVKYLWLEELLIIVNCEKITRNKMVVVVPTRTSYQKYENSIRDTRGQLYSKGSETWESIALNEVCFLRSYVQRMRSKRSEAYRWKFIERNGVDIATWIPPVFKFVDVVRADE